MGLEVESSQIHLPAFVHFARQSTQHDVRHFVTDEQIYFTWSMHAAVQLISMRALLSVWFCTATGIRITISSGVERFYQWVVKFAAFGPVVRWCQNTKLVILGLDVVEDFRRPSLKIDLNATAPLWKWRFPRFRHGCGDSSTSFARPA